MDYVGQVINESLRRYTPGNVLLRICTKDYNVSGTSHVIEKGVNLMLPMSAIHNDPEYFPDPLKFDPDRFSPEEVQKRNPFTFLPFGEGPRNCMGLRSVRNSNSPSCRFTFCFHFQTDLGFFKLAWEW